MGQYVALLRGLNVGGKNLVRMADLREAVAELGGEDVETYIASGNAVFRAPRALDLGPGLSERFGLEIKALVLTAARMQKVVDSAPAGFGGEDRLCDVIFPIEPVTAAQVFARLDPREGIDEARTAAGVVYSSRLKARASGSRLSKIAGTPEYKQLTIRNWNTTRRLAAMLADRI